MIESAISNFGRIDVLVNNAGVIRDASFNKMTDTEWETVISVHIIGTYKCTKAAWPHFRKQGYGRVANTVSVAGLYGSFGQCNYSAAKHGLIGLTKTLAKEGRKYNILCNYISLLAAKAMATGILTDEAVNILSPDWIVAIVAVLAHPSNQSETGSIFEASGGHVSKLRWQRAARVLLKPDQNYTAGALLEKWTSVGDFSQPS